MRNIPIIIIDTKHGKPTFFFTKVSHNYRTLLFKNTSISTSRSISKKAKVHFHNTLSNAFKFSMKVRIPPSS